MLSAGGITVNNGVIQIVNNSSGHYRPDEEGISRLIALLILNGYEDVNNIRIEPMITRPPQPPEPPKPNPPEL